MELEDSDYDLQFEYGAVSFLSPSPGSVPRTAGGAGNRVVGANTASASGATRIFDQGSYTFRVSACNWGGTWSEPMEVRFRVDSQSGWPWRPRRRWNERIDEERKGEAAAALALSERKYRQLFEHMTAAFALHEMVYDQQGRPIDYRFLEVNPAYERLTGITATAVLGKAATEAMPDIEQRWVETYGKVALSGEPIAYESHEEKTGKIF